MSLEQAYRTVKHAAIEEMTEKKSRFIAHCTPVSSEEEAIAFIGEVRAKHPQATHNVYAYIVRENQAMRYSDDGEPGGTAGVPTLEVLRKENLTDVCVVVTRYFGGVMLGAGGLVRAYGKSAKLGVCGAEIVTRTLCTVIALSCDYTLAGKLQYAISEREHTIRRTEYGERVCLEAVVPTEQRDAFCKQMEDVSCGKAEITVLGTEFVDL